MTAAAGLLWWVALAANEVVPTDVVVSRYSFVDFGPPFSYYDLFFLTASGQGTRVERASLSASPDECFQPATLTGASAEIPARMMEVFGV